MRSVLTAFALGSAAVGALALAAALGIAALADGTLQVAVGQLELVTVERAPRGTTTEFGAGLAVLALLGGALNAAAAAVLRARAARSP